MISMKMTSKKKKMFRNAGASVLAIVLVVALMVGLMPSDALAAASDADTSTSYSESLGDNASTEFAGRIWTDKSVYTDDATFEMFDGKETTIEKAEGEDFLVAYSALGTSQSVSGSTHAPVDVVFIIDISGSMSNSESKMDNGLSRIANTVVAVNNSIEKLMSMNDYTRVAVVAFSNTAEVLLSLDRYEKISNGSTTYDYFSLNRTSAGGEVNLFTRAIGSDGNRISTTKAVTGGTNIQMGLYTGMNILATETSTTVDIEGQTVKRIPSVILLSDGAPTYSSGDTNKTQSNWWEPLNNNNDGPGGSPYYGNGFKALMTGAYMKNAINNNYGVAGTAYETTLYTVGMGISELDNYEGNGKDRKYTGEQDLAYMTLNPADNWDETDSMATAIKDNWVSYTNQSPNSNNTISVTVNNNDSYTVRHPQSPLSDIYTETDKNALKNLVDDYYDANSASGVTDVFNQIVANISISTPEVPTEVGSGDPVTSGYITYTDPLGEYTEVKDVKAIVYAGNVFTQKTVSPADGTRPTTYVFSGEVDSPVYGEQDIAQILIEVTADEKGNETIEIKIPASVIPVRVNTVTLNADGTVDTHTNNGAYPARVIYSVSVKDEIMKNIGTEEDPVEIVDITKVSEEYIEENKNEDGSVNFYSNLYTAENVVNGHTAGNTIVTFEPSHTNPFYYMQENVPIYTDKDCTIQATGKIDSSTKYYYKTIHYHGADVVETYLERTGEQLLKTDIVEIDGKLYRAKGSPRLNRILDFEGTKDDPTITNTAKDFYAPTFEYAEGSDSAYDGQYVIYLGNNGVLSKAIGGHLAISKSVTAAEGLTAPTIENGFEFTIDFNGNETLEGKFNYEVVDAAGEVVRKNEIADGEKIYLNDGETATIKNLPAGTTYKVTETAVAGFVTTPQGNEGTIIAGDIVTAGFTNRYEVEELQYPTEGGFGGKKVLDGRAWDNDSFTFLLTPYNDAPLPEGYDPDAGVTVTTATAVDADTYKAEFVFGDGTDEGNKITFTKPGVYRYTVVEREPETAAPGLSYSRALYRIVITVVDNGNGTLSATSDIQQLYTDGAIPMFTYNADNEIVVTDSTQDEIVFTNTYTAGSVTRVPVATKTYVDNSGNNPLVSGMFEFKLEALGIVENGELVANTASQVPMPSNANGETSVTTENEGGNVTFFPVEFKDEHLEGKTTITYQYKMSEINLGKTGMTYDDTEYVINITLSTDASSHDLIVTAVYSDNKADTDDSKIRLATFTNVYTPEPTTVTIEGQKTLNGRDMKDKETFNFILTPSASTELATQNGSIDITYTEASVIGGKDGQAEGFSFGTITFTKPGVYTFFINETAGEAGGVAYDSHISTVTITVEDKNGKLEAIVVYSDGEKATFENNYTTEFTGDSVNLSGTKTLTGQSLEEGEFFFVVEDVNAETSKLVANAANGNVTFLKDITYEAAGKYVYKIYEQIPSPGVKGMIYDKSIYRLTVEVSDDGNGNLLVNSKVLDKSTDDEKTWSQVEVITFANSYAPERKTLTLPILNKVISGDRNKTLDAGEFDFVLSIESASSADGILLPGENEEAWNKALAARTVTVGNNVDGTIAFGNITFTKAGTYSLLAKEVVPADDDKAAGIEYSTQEIRATIRVIDDSAGNLTWTLLSESGGQSFTNKYHTTGEVSFEIKKNFTGREWLSSDKFRFEVVILDPDTQAAVDAGDIEFPSDNNGIQILEVTKDKQTVTSETVTFNKAGTYKFIIREINDEIAGITYDDTLHEITVIATDNNGTGELKFEISDSANTDNDPTIITFNNVYDSKSTQLAGYEHLTVAKNFEGRLNNEWLDTDEFTFVLEPADEETKTAITQYQNTKETEDVSGIELPESNPVDVETAYEGADNVYKSYLQVTNANKAHSHFGNIIFHQTGEFVFKITEVLPVEVTENPHNGITYDLEPRTVKVIVYDNNKGELVAEIVDEDSDDLTFKNTYGTSEVTLEGATNLVVTKVLEGRDWFNTDAFTFELIASGEGAKAAVEAGDIILPKETTITITNEDAVDGENAFSKAFGDIIFKKTGIYGFSIVEVVPTENPIHGVTYDTHEARVVVTVTDGGEGKLVVATPTYLDSMTFTNSYAPDPTIIALEGTKVLNGRTLNTEEFSFQIAAITEGAPMPAVSTVTNGVNGNAEKVAFGAITYKTAGIYEYAITEVKGDLPGIKYDERTVKATVTVAYDEKTGVLTSRVSYDGDGFVFKNEYITQQTDPVSITADKTVTPEAGHEFTMKEGDFSFEIIPADANPASDPISTAEKTNLADGSVALAQAAYTEAGTYVYTVHEKAGSRSGISYDSSTYEITVVVTDDESLAKLSAAVTITKDGTPVNRITFDNGYAAGETTALIYGHKNLNGGHKALEAGEFKFTISAEDGTPMPAATTVANDAAGLFTFDAITYTVPGEYVYTISEVNEGKAGITYDTAVHTVTVNVTDENGELKANVSGVSAEDGTPAIVFNNTYVPTPAAVTLSGTKTLDGRTQNAGEFAFELIDSTGAVVKEATNNADGTFAFEALSFTTAGTYNFTIVEKDTNVAGVTYNVEDAVYGVQVVITDVDATLTAEITYVRDNEEVADVVFKNKYEAAPTAVQLGAIKYLEGRELKAEEFKFILEDEEGNKLYATNAADGTILFEKIEYTEAGEYVYRISEEKGTLENVTYDETVYTVTVSVVDGKEGYLVATVSNDGEAPVFKNTYKAPEVPEEPQKPSEPEKGTPGSVDTGDSTNIIVYLVLALAAIAAIIALAVVKRKGRNR